MYSLPGHRVFLLHLSAQYKITSSTTPAINPPTMEPMNLAVSSITKTKLIKIKHIPSKDTYNGPMLIQLPAGHVNLTVLMGWLY